MIYTISNIGVLHRRPPDGAANLRNRTTVIHCLVGCQNPIGCLSVLFAPRPFSPCSSSRYSPSIYIFSSRALHFVNFCGQRRRPFDRNQRPPQLGTLHAGFAHECIAKPTESSSYAEFDALSALAASLAANGRCCCPSSLPHSPRDHHLNTFELVVEDGVLIAVLDVINAVDVEDVIPVAVVVVVVSVVVVPALIAVDTGCADGSSGEGDGPAGGGVVGVDAFGRPYGAALDACARAGRAGGRVADGRVAGDGCVSGGVACGGSVSGDGVGGGGVGNGGGGVGAVVVVPVWGL